MQTEYKPASLDKIAAFMAGLSIASNQMRLAQLALTELLAWCAFADRRQREGVQAS